MGKQATAELQPDGKYLVTHADGSEELLTEGQFKAKYELEDENPKVKGEAKSDEGEGTSSEPVPEPKKSDKPDVPDAVQGTQGPQPTVITSEIDGGPIGSQGGDEDPPTLAKEHRPETHDADDAFWGEGKDDFVKEYAEAVEAELAEMEEGIKAVRAELKSVKSGKAEDFGAVRSAMHELSHGKSLMRTAHVATVRHDGPERLQPAPSPEDNVSSGPGEELNYAGRKAGK